jgi:hypothetical protein
MKSLLIKQENGAVEMRALCSGAGSTGGAGVMRYAVLYGMPDV